MTMAQADFSIHQTVNKMDVVLGIVESTGQIIDRVKDRNGRDVSETRTPLTYLLQAGGARAEYHSPLFAGISAGRDVALVVERRRSTVNCVVNLRDGSYRLDSSANPFLRNNVVGGTIMMSLILALPMLLPHFMVFSMLKPILPPDSNGAWLQLYPFFLLPVAWFTWKHFEGRMARKATAQHEAIDAALRRSGILLENLRLQ